MQRQLFPLDRPSPPISRVLSDRDIRAQGISLALVLVLGFAVLAVPASGQGTETAEYTVRFHSTWSADSHPIDFPENPHYSRLVGGLHDDTVSFWNPGELATEGIEEMAERGQVSPLDQEIEAAIAAGNAAQVLIGPNLPDSPGMRTLDFTVSKDHPLITLVTMVAPSPDWFVGVSGLSLLEGGDWVQQKVVTLRTWDAGTDSGVTYTSSNADTVPAQPIHLADSGPFVGSVPVGTFTFTRKDTPPPSPLFLRDGRFRIGAVWTDFAGRRAGAHPTQLTDDTGYFWFFEEVNVELFVKVIDGCGHDGFYWVFSGGLTNVGVELTVEDTETGQVEVYENRLGEPFAPIVDTRSFAGCP